MLQFRLLSGVTRVLLMVAMPVHCVISADAPRPWPPNQFAPLTLERIEALPPTERPAWKAYIELSKKIAALKPTPIPKGPILSKPIAAPPKGGLHTVGLSLDQEKMRHTSPGPTIIADRIVVRQSAAGGWTKGIDYTQPPGATATNHDAWSRGTFDNDATILELRYLARVITLFGSVTNAVAWKSAFERGMQYIFNAQYPNGGIPQIYPLVGGYHDNVTYNDDAMVRVLNLLREVADGRNDFTFVPQSVRDEAAIRFQRGIDCILASQIISTNGLRTVWCQQHDALTLKPAAARNFEPISAVAAESASITALLMKLPDCSPEVLQSVDAAVEWFRLTGIQNITYNRFTNDAVVVRTPGAPTHWARLYELETNKPIFGDRDRIIHYELAEISEERRRGYSWYGQWPAEVLKTYDAWRKERTASPSKPAIPPNSD